MPGVLLPFLARARPESPEGKGARGWSKGFFSTLLRRREHIAANAHVEQTQGGLPRLLAFKKYRSVAETAGFSGSLTRL